MGFMFENDRPIYIQLVEQLELFIISGRISSGERLPSVRDLAIEYQVNPNTMQKALVELEQRHLVYTERTNGKYVTNDRQLINKLKKELANNKVSSFLDDMAKIGFSKEEIIEYLNKIGGTK